MNVPTVGGPRRGVVETRRVVLVDVPRCGGGQKRLAMMKVRRLLWYRLGGDAVLFGRLPSRTLLTLMRDLRVVGRRPSREAQ